SVVAPADNEHVSARGRHLRRLLSDRAPDRRRRRRAARRGGAVRAVHGAVVCAAAPAPVPHAPRRLSVRAMLDRLLADTVVALHLAFIVFVAVGGLLVAWRPAFAALHLPALAWGLYTESTGTICPLTPLENAL